MVSLLLVSSINIVRVVLYLYITINSVCNMCASPNIIGVIKSRRMRWSGHVACIGVMRNAY